MLNSVGDGLAATCSRLRMSKSQLRLHLCSSFDFFKVHYPEISEHGAIQAGRRGQGNFGEFIVSR